MSRIKSVGEIFAVSALTLALAACGGGGGGSSESTAGTTSTQPTTPTTPDPVPAKARVATSPAGSQVNLTSADCTLFQTTPPEPTLTAADEQEINSVLKTASPTHGYQVFLRAAQDVTWWVRSDNSEVSLSGLGTGIHESNHAIDSLLTYQCNADGYKRYYLDGQIHAVNTRAGETPNRVIIDSVYPAALKTTRAMRFDIYVTGTASNNGNDFSSLLEEFNAYSGAATLELNVRSNSELAYLWSTPNIVSTVDEDVGGMVDFMLFMQTYLQAARVSNPTDYASLQGQADTIAFMQLLWTRAETLLEAVYPYSTTATGGGGTVVPSDVMQHIYSSQMLAELDAFGITHKSASDWTATYLKDLVP